MTLQKIEILTIIASAKPKSVYELAKMVDRALGPVQNDCYILESIGSLFLKNKRQDAKL